MRFVALLLLLIPTALQAQVIRCPNCFVAQNTIVVPTTVQAVEYQPVVVEKTVDVVYQAVAVADPCQTMTHVR